MFRDVCFQRQASEARVRLCAREDRSPKGPHHPSNKRLAAVCRSKKKTSMPLPGASSLQQRVGPILPPTVRPDPSHLLLPPPPPRAPCGIVSLQERKPHKRQVVMKLLRFDSQVQHAVLLLLSGLHVFVAGAQTPLSRCSSLDPPPLARPWRDAGSGTWLLACTASQSQGHENGTQRR